MTQHVDHVGLAKVEGVNSRVAAGKGPIRQARIVFGTRVGLLVEGEAVGATARLRIIAIARRVAVFGLRLLGIGCELVTAVTFAIPLTSSVAIVVLETKLRAHLIGHLVIRGDGLVESTSNIAVGSS
jgi:hypothetical protein